MHIQPFLKIGQDISDIFSFVCFLYIFDTYIIINLFQLKKLLRNVLDPHALTLQTAQLVRAWVYDDKNQCYDLSHPVTAPEWYYVQQKDQVYDTDFEGKYIKLCLKLIFVINMLIFIYFVFKVTELQLFLMKTNLKTNFKTSKIQYTYL